MDIINSILGGGRRNNYSLTNFKPKPFKLNSSSIYNNIMGVKSSPKTRKNISNLQFMQKKATIKNAWKDYDHTGVPNILDCFPYDKKRHSAMPNVLMQQRIEKLPIFVHGKSGERPVHISSKKADMPTKRKVYSLFKKYPTIPTRIKEGGKAVVYTSTRDEEDVPSAGKRGYGFATTEPVRITGKGRPREGAVVVRMADEPYAKKKSTKYGFLSRHEAAKTTVHEEEHIKQYKQIKKRPSLAKRWFKGKYEKQIGEKRAFAAEEKYESNTKKEIPVSTGKKFIEKKAGKEYAEEVYNKYKPKEEKKVAESFRETFKNEDED